MNRLGDMILAFLAIFAAFGVVATVMALLFAPTPAHSQTVCVEREALIDRLASKYNESRRGFGVRNVPNGVVVVEFYAAESGTWRLVTVLPDGRACVVAVGEHWQHVEPTPTGEAL